MGAVFFLFHADEAQLSVYIAEPGIYRRFYAFRPMVSKLLLRAYTLAVSSNLFSSKKSKENNLFCANMERKLFIYIFF